MEEERDEFNIEGKFTFDTVVEDVRNRIYSGGGIGRAGLFDW